MAREVTMTFFLDEDVTPELFAEKVMRQLAGGALREGERALVTTDDGRPMHMTVHGTNDYSLRLGQ